MFKHSVQVYDLYGSKKEIINAYVIKQKGMKF